MLTVAEAQHAILASIEPRQALRLPILKSLGSVLAEDIIADIDNPPFNNSAVDGYAVRSQDVRGASADSPVHLQLLGEVAAGQTSNTSVLPGACLKVFTGAPIPEGADAMVMVEDTHASDLEIAVLAEAQPGDHVRKQGGDVHKGDRVLESGAVIGSPEIAMMAAMGSVNPLCFQKPRVAVISTGDELVDPSEVPGAGQIRDSNRFALAALIAETGAELHSISHAADDATQIERVLKTASGLDGTAAADIIVTSGGVSVGDRDFVKPVLEKLGILDFWRVKMKPGKPIAVGRIGKSLFFGLPGNPVSTVVTFELFVRPVILRMAGHSKVFRPRITATLDCEVQHRPGREEYVRASVKMVNNEFVASPTGAQGSGILSSMIGANALLVIPVTAASLPTGSTVEALLLAAAESIPYDNH